MSIIRIASLAALALLAACGETEQTVRNDAAEATTTTTAPIALGQTGVAEGIDMTVTEADTRNSIGPAQLGMSAGEGETYVVVRYTLKNTASSPLGLMDRPAINLVDANDQSFASDDMSTAMLVSTMDETAGLVTDLNPGVSARTAMVWKVDANAFDPATWRVTVASSPSLTFALR